MDEKRYLRFHFPEIADDDPGLPANLQYAQLFTGLGVDEMGWAKPLAEIATIFVEAYQVPEFELYPAFHKPISKFITIADGDFESY